jgi:hypothetical protein
MPARHHYEDVFLSAFRPAHLADLELIVLGFWLVADCAQIVDHIKAIDTGLVWQLV